MKKNDNSMLKSVASALTALVGFGLMALAILRWHEIGWGGLIWLAAFLTMFGIRTPFALRCRANTIARARKGWSEKILLAAMFGTMMVLPLLYLGAGVLTFADYPLDDAATLIGGLLQIPFLALFWLSHADLGRNWSPGLEVRESHELVTNGIYARIRNPMYAAIWMSALAQPLLIHNWIAGFLVVPAFAAMWFIRVPQEEAMMRETFGKAYDDYCRRAGRLFPRQ